MKNLRYICAVFSGATMLFVMVAVSTPLPARADVTAADINAQTSIVEDKLVITLTEYVKLLQLMLIDKLEDRVRALRIARGLSV